MDYIKIFQSALGGLGLFLFGMHAMGAGLQKVAGSKMKSILESITKNRFLAVCLGAFVTAIIQSSSATTVMVVGFVNVGLMNLVQSVGIIMGANIGTTVTGWIVSAIEWAKFFKPEMIASIAAIVGAFMVLFAKNDKTRNSGEIIVGFGVLFLGTVMMSSGLKPLSNSPAFISLFQNFGSNPVLGILVGALVTAIIQSSSASVGILQTLAMSGVVTFNSAVYIIMGQNIGTCVTAILSSMGTSKNAKAASYIHLLFNTIGSIIFSIISIIFFTFINKSLGFEKISATQISLFHTGFNILCTILLFPFANLLVRIAKRLADCGEEEVDEGALIHLDDRLLTSPPIAIENCIKEISRMGDIAYENLESAYSAIMNKDRAMIEKVLKREEKIDELQTGITTFLVSLCNAGLTEEENILVTSLFHTVNDVERIGDYCENLAELTEYMIAEKLSFSDSAVQELEKIMSETLNCVESAIKAFSSDDMEAAEEAIKSEDRVDNLEENYRMAHIDRLAKNNCDPKTSVVFLDIITSLERVADHALNVTEVAIKKFA